MDDGVPLYEESSGCHRYQDHCFLPECFTAWQPLVFPLSSCFLKTVCFAAYSFDRSSPACSERSGANKWDFWSVQSALTSRINFLLFYFSVYINVFIWIERSHVLFYLITYFLVVLGIEPRTSWILAKPSALVLSFSINLFILGGNMIHHR